MVNGIIISATRHASKGVVSLSLPEEHRPYIESPGEPIDFIYSPFGVFSRMNLSQTLELTAAKPTHRTDLLIKKDPDNIVKYLSELNNFTVKYLGDQNYYNEINKLCDLMKQDKNCREDITNNILENNLYLEVPSFTKIDIRQLLSNVNPKPNENVVIPKNCIKYLKQKLGAFSNLIVNDDITIPDIFAGSIYIQKLHKIAEKLITYRDLGPLKAGSMQPEKGRAAGGGSTLGSFLI